MGRKLLQVNQNTGLLPPVFDEKDFVFGAVSGIVQEDRNTLGDWRDFIITGESQRYDFFDDFGCVSHGAENSVEIQLNLLFKSNLIRQEDIEWLRYQGYFDKNGHINFDDRALVVLSNTTPGVGNTFKNVWDAARKFGLWPQGSTPFNQQWSSESYYDKSDFPKNSYDLGLEFLKRFYIQYERVPVTLDMLKKTLKHAPLQVGIPICEGYNTGENVSACGLQSVHAVTLLAIDEKGIYHIYDSYDPYSKSLSKGYKIDYAYKGVISPVISIDNKKKEKFIFTKNLKFGDYNNDVTQLGFRMIELGYWPDTQYNPPGPHYGVEMARAVRAYQRANRITNWWQDIIWRGKFCGPTTRLLLNSRPLDY